jgi:dihydroorotase
MSNDWILIDPDSDWIVDPSALKSRGKNTPLAGRRLRGRVVMTVCRGQLVMERVPQHA